MADDAPGAITAERDRLRLALAEIKRQCKTLRQRLRREQAEHQLTLKRLEALRAELCEVRGKLDARGRCGA